MYFIFDIFVYRYVVLNLLCQKNHIGWCHTTSIMGYSLIPIGILAIVKVLLTMNSLFGMFLTFLIIGWCTFTATRFFEYYMNMKAQRYLISYPVLLFYICFALLTIF